MDLDLLMRRQAVSEWRDRQLFQAISTINAAATAARGAFDELLEDAALMESAFSPDRFVNGRIDNLMHKEMASRLEGLLQGAAHELRTLDARFEDLANALVASGVNLVFPTTSAIPETATSTDLAPSDPMAASSPGLIERLSSLPIAQSAREWGAWAAEGFSNAADNLSKALQSGSGLHENLRKLAADRIARAWMGDSGTPRPIKSQIVTLIEDVTAEARSLNL